ncbi:hypothetical protein ASG22_09800 [Chryseobacterium sp. Leaf405]|uniref:hypothetical protein n=1 Tax=Chryseobacterium sp. Leaf405 TaxID=1736367 RepID=UPI0006F54C9E|nr:hypothetical protein [Chryseobacterium sp. Leaf405]KQT24295.1 hypothetical protein ASG22_09800 [Chryseobacterium sp. Leaf405]
MSLEILNNKDSNGLLNSKFLSENNLQNGLLSNQNFFQKNTFENIQNDSQLDSPMRGFHKPDSLNEIVKNQINYDSNKQFINPYTYYYKYIVQNSEENLYETYFNTNIINSKSDILIFYLSNSNKELFIKITNRSDRLLDLLSSNTKYKYPDDPTKDITFKERMIFNILQDAQADFLFTYNQILEAIDNAILDFSFIKSDKNIPLESSRYSISLNQLKDRVNLKEQGTAKTLLEINREIIKMRVDEKYTYNRWINSIADPNNYFGIHSVDNKNFSANDLNLLLTQLKDYKKNAKLFQSGELISIKELQLFVEENLTAGGDRFKWFINTPFFGLNIQQRKAYIDMFCVEDEFFFSRISIAGGVSHGDLVLMLFSTCKNDQELLEIILELEKDDRLFKLLHNLKLNAFKELSILISNVYMDYLEKEKQKGDLYKDAIENGRQIHFNNNTFGNHNVENFDPKNNKLVFETRQNVIVELFTDSDYNDTIISYLQKPVSCKPLDIISFTPERDIKFKEFEFSAKHNYQLPACLVYLLYRQESIGSVIFTGLFTLQVALCLTGVGEVIAAIEAGSTFGVIWTGSAVAIDSAFASTLVKEVQEDYPTYTKAVNYIVWVRIIADVIKVRRLENDINSVLKKASKEVDDFISKITTPTARAFVKTLPNEWQKSIVNGMLKWTFQGRTFLKIDLKGVIWEIQCFREVENAEIIAEFKELTINTKIITNKGKEISRSYTDNVDVIKSVYKDRDTGIEHHKFGFRIKFNEGKLRDAEYMNYTHEKNSNTPPYALSPLIHSKVKDRILMPGEKFYIVEYESATGPGNFLTDKPIFTIPDLREKLAVLEKWKPIKPGDPLVIREYVVLKEMKVRDGYIGPMEETTTGSVNFGKTYKGGERQFECYDRPKSTDMDVVFERNDLFEKVLK